MSERAVQPERAWPWVAAVFGCVLVAQLGLVRLAGTDVPFFDQWDVEGRWLYPTWRDGTLHAGDFLRPLNEHRIAWTHALNVALFAINGQWDPLVQLAVIALLRAACAAGVGWLIFQGLIGRQQVWAAVGVGCAFLPHLAWHSVLWGIESQVYFSLGFSLLTMALLGEGAGSLQRTLAGCIVGCAALLAMGPSNLVPVALLLVAILKTVERRRVDRETWTEVGPALGLLVIAWMLRTRVSEHDVLGASSVREFLRAAARTLAWPHVAMPLAAIPMNLPLVILIVRRLLRQRKPASGENLVLLLGAWSACVALATAWARGGSPELRVGVPSRYVDFLVLLPIANGWCAWRLVQEMIGPPRLRWLAPAWGVFVLIGWVGLSAEVMRGIVGPRARDREAPVRLLRAYQASGDASVFAGQPRLLWPHPYPDESVRPVLADPRMRGALPPSLQPERPVGPVSRVVRVVVGQ